ncbi:hypothetical protein ACI2KR_31145 [Pseudomonas luteola]
MQRTYNSTSEIVSLTCRGMRLAIASQGPKALTFKDEDYFVNGYVDHELGDVAKQILKKTDASLNKSIADFIERFIRADVSAEFPVKSSRIEVVKGNKAGELFLCYGKNQEYVLAKVSDGLVTAYIEQDIALIQTYEYFGVVKGAGYEVDHTLLFASLAIEDTLHKIILLAIEGVWAKD